MVIKNYILHCGMLVILSRDILMSVCC